MKLKRHLHILRPGVCAGATFYSTRHLHRARDLGLHAVPDNQPGLDSCTKPRHSRVHARHHRLYAALLGHAVRQCQGARTCGSCGPGWPRPNAFTCQPCAGLCTAGCKTCQAIPAASRTVLAALSALPWLLASSGADPHQGGPGYCSGATAGHVGLQPGKCNGSSTTCVNGSSIQQCDTRA